MCWGGDAESGESEPLAPLVQIYSFASSYRPPFDLESGMAERLTAPELLLPPWQRTYKRPGAEVAKF